MNTHYQLVTNGEELRRAVDDLSTKHAIGLDTETTDLDPYTARLRLIQLASPEGVRIVDLHRFNEDVKRSEALASLRQIRCQVYQAQPRCRYWRGVRHTPCQSVGFRW